VIQNDVSKFFMLTPMLAKSYLDTKTRRPSINADGWYMSEKYDGERALWDGNELRSRNGSIINAPKWFLDMLPESNLDGELWMGRGRFSDIGHVRKKEPNDALWKSTKYMIFDSPDEGRYPIEDRLTRVHTICRKLRESWSSGDCPVQEIVQVPVENNIDTFFKNVIKGGGEGIVLREPGSKYLGERSSSFLKYKQTHEMEVVICGYKQGKGRNAGKLGSFAIHPIDDDGHIAKHIVHHVAGISDHVRNNYRNTHPIGTVCTIIFTEYTRHFSPRHPRFKCIRGFVDLSDPHAKWTPDMPSIKITLKRPPMLSVKLKDPLSITLKTSTVHPIHVTLKGDIK